ncbi:MAG: hypothetical protein H6835_16115 [Planctomycetes bacterium]|nr:hypothetical protein [Planctomycetota bacterium]
MNPSAEDRLLQRYLDRELSADESAAFAGRLLTDATLRDRVQQAEALRAPLLAAAAAPTPRASMAFTQKVMAEVRRQPSREQLMRFDLSASTLRVCRRILLAAAVLCAIGAAALTGLFDRPGADTLQAAPGEVQQEIDRLDAAIRADQQRQEQGRPHGVPRRGN